MKPLAACSLAIALVVLACNLSNCASPPLGSEGSEFAGSDRCTTCHDQESRFWRYGAHRDVACERCHGSGAEHARADSISRRGMSLGGVELCMSCHQQGADPSSNEVSTIGSFEGHLRDLERDHRIKLDRRKSGTSCVYCHDPHLLE